MTENILEFIKKLKDNELWSLYAQSIKELKERELIRTRNIVGERGEFLVIETYSKNPSIPNLQAAPQGTQNIDAISRKGARYSIKTVTHPGRGTGVFHGITKTKEESPKKQHFEYAIIVIIDKEFELKEMYELSWKQFLYFKRWHSTVRAWMLPINEIIKKEAKKIYPLTK